ncbi:hypothetical protein IDM32_05715 [Acinetobacter seifertii]|nr:hypothetical protein [Acinetobacter seifertii]
MIGLAFTFCRLIFKADLFLLWIGLAYVIPSIALFAQCLMNNAQLTLAAPFTAILYLLGSWFGAYAISLKLKVSFRHKLALAISLCTIAILTFFIYTAPNMGTINYFKYFFGFSRFYYNSPCTKKITVL